MGTVVQPLNQEQRISPYSQRLFDFGTTDSRVYISRVANSLLSSLTLGRNDSTSYLILDDGILDGLETSHSLAGNTLTVTVNPGYVIQDLTQVVFEESTTLDIDLSSYSDTGSIVVAINYKFLNSVASNPALLKLEYVSSDGLTVLPDGWSSERDRIVVTRFTFSKDGSGNVTGVSNLCQTPIINGIRNPDQIEIEGTTYYTGAPISFLRNIHDLMNNYIQPVYLSFTTLTLNATSFDYISAEGGTTITLPSSPSVGDMVWVLDILGEAATKNITIDRNGSKINGVAADFVIDTDNYFVGFVYQGSTIGWDISDNDIHTANVSTSSEASGDLRQYELHPADFAYDTDDDGTSPDKVFGILDSAKFPESTDGAIWASMKFPDGFVPSLDLEFEIIYLLDATDASKNVKLTSKCWIIEENGDASELTPTETEYTNLASTVTEGVLKETTVLTISGGTYGTDPYYVSFYLKRDADHANDTYSGNLQIVSILMKQGV